MCNLMMHILDSKFVLVNSINTYLILKINVEWGETKLESRIDTYLPGVLTIKQNNNFIIFFLYFTCM